MANEAKIESEVLGDPLIKVAIFWAIVFVAGLILIELSRDESARAGVAGGGMPAMTTTATQ